MTTPATLPDTPNAATGPSVFLSNMFTSLSMSAGINKMVHDIAAAWNALGSTPAAAAALGYTRLHDGVDKGILVPAQGLVVPNLIVDPAIHFWPDGTSFTSIADGTWGPAGLIYRKSGAAVHDLLRSTDVPAVHNMAGMANYSCHLDVTTADTSIAAGDYALIATRIEGYDWKKHLDQRQFTFPFFVKSPKAGTHCLFARNSGNDRSCVMEYTVSVADTWEFKAVTFPASPSAGTWDYTNGRGIEIGWPQYAGSTFQTTAGAWQTGNFYATANQVNCVDSTANNFKIALLGPPLAGAYATPFRSLPHPLEDYRARRYYEVLGGGGLANNPFADGFWSSTTDANGWLGYVRKRAAPSITVSAASDLYAASAGAVPIAGTGIVVFFPEVDSCWFRVQTAGSGVAGDGTFMGFINTSGRIKIASRIP